MRALIAQGATQFLEAGPGSVLTGLLRQIDKSQPCLNVENEATLQKAKATSQSEVKSPQHWAGAASPSACAIEWT